MDEFELDSSILTWHLNPCDSCLDISNCSGDIGKGHRYAGVFANKVSLGGHVNSVDKYFWVREDSIKVGVGLRKCGCHEGEESSPWVHVELWVLARIWRGRGCNDSTV